MKSDNVKKGMQQAPHRSLFNALGFTEEEMNKPMVGIVSSYNEIVPGHMNLDKIVNAVKLGVAEAGGFGARYFCTDICDGESQGHDGINYSLPSRDMIANMIEIHANATPFHGGVFIASCDKGMPAHLMAVGRVNIQSIVVTGGVMDAGPDLLTLEQLGKYNAMCERGEITKAKVDDCYQAWRSHASKGNSFHLIRRMDKFYKRLWNDQETEVTDNEN